MYRVAIYIQILLYTIYCYHEKSYSLLADINSVGIVGTIIFTQDQKYYPVSIRTHLQPIYTNLKYGWQIHRMPILWDYSQDDYCKEAVINSELIYNLTAKHGLINQRGFYNDETMNILSFKDSFAGNTLVIIDVDIGPISCSTILPLYKKQVILVADFYKNLAGQVLFSSYFNSIFQKTLIMGHLYENYGVINNRPNDWFIGSKVYDSDNFDCFYYGLQDTPYDPMKVMGSERCDVLDGTNCMIGDLSSKVGKVYHGVSLDWSSVQPFTYKDPFLPLDGINSIAWHALYIVDPDTKNILSCSVIKPMEEVKYKVLMKKTTNKIEKISGVIYFKQLTPYHSTYIKIRVKDQELYGLEEPPVFALFDQLPDGDDCNSIGTILLDREIKPKPILAPGMFPDYTVDSIHNSTIEIGFITTFTLFTKNTIFGMTIAMLDSLDNKNSSPISCGQILPIIVNDITTYIANFSNNPILTGFVIMTQYLYHAANYQYSDTFVVILLHNINGTKSTNHKFHIHANLITENDPNTTTDCSSSGTHFNPYDVSVTQPMYTTECSPEYPRRCEVGDLSSKYQLLNISSIRSQYIDTNLNLYGPNSVLGRSMVIHEENKGKRIIACANIVKYVTAT